MSIELPPKFSARFELERLKADDAFREARAVARTYKEGEQAAFEWGWDVAVAYLEQLVLFVFGTEGQYQALELHTAGQNAIRGAFSAAFRLKLPHRGDGDREGFIDRAFPVFEKSAEWEMFLFNVRQLAEWQAADCTAVEAPKAHHAQECGSCTSPVDLITKLDRVALWAEWKARKPRHRGAVKELCERARAHPKDLEKWRRDDPKFPDWSTTSERIVAALRQD